MDVTDGHAGLWHTPLCEKNLTPPHRRLHTIYASAGPRHPRVNVAWPKLESAEDSLHAARNFARLNTEAWGEGAAPSGRRLRPSSGGCLSSCGGLTVPACRVCVKFFSRRGGRILRVLGVEWAVTGCRTGPRGSCARALCRALRLCPCVLSLCVQVSMRGLLVCVHV